MNLFKQLELLFRDTPAARARPVQFDTALPEYTVRVSGRAKRLHLRVLPVGKVEVVLPKRMSLRHVEPFVSQHRDWITKELHNLARSHPRAPELDVALPLSITFPALGYSWQVQYGQRRSYVKDAIVLIKDGTAEQQGNELRRLVFKLAKTELPVRIAHVAGTAGLDFNEIRVRRQRTLWGSCTAQKNISLNCNLVFLPPELAHYVYVHELCHTVHLNHSRRFWSLVERHIPDYRQAEKELSLAARHIPVWAI